MSSNCTLSAHTPTRVMRKLLESGAPGEIRTPDLLLRRQSLYPAELRAHCIPVYLQELLPSIGKRRRQFWRDRSESRFTVVKT